MLGVAGEKDVDVAERQRQHRQGGRVGSVVRVPTNEARSVTGETTELGRDKIRGLVDENRDNRLDQRTQRPG